MSKTITFLSKDFTKEASFRLEKKPTKEELEFHIKNAEFALSRAMSKHEEIVQDMYKFKDDKDKLKELIKEKDLELSKGKEQIGLVIIWEDYNFIPYKDFSINDIKFS